MLSARQRELIERVCLKAPQEERFQLESWSFLGKTSQRWVRRNNVWTPKQDKFFSPLALKQYWICIRADLLTAELWVLSESKWLWIRVSWCREPETESDFAGFEPGTETRFFEVWRQRERVSVKAGVGACFPEPQKPNWNWDQRKISQRPEPGPRLCFVKRQVQARFREIGVRRQSQGFLEDSKEFLKKSFSKRSERGSTYVA